jgi:hypothetical protein
MFSNRIALIGGAFGLLASLNSFLIAYDEGKRRRSSGLDLWLKPVYKAAVTLAGFVLLIIALCLVLPQRLALEKNGTGHRQNHHLMDEVYALYIVGQPPSRS